MYTPPTTPGALGQARRNPPGAVASLVLGVVSIAAGLSCVAAPLGAILAVVGLLKARKARELARRFPGSYGEPALALAGLICSIVGLAIGAAMVLGAAILLLISLGS